MEQLAAQNLLPDNLRTAAQMDAYDLFDVIAAVAYGVRPLTRAERAALTRGAVRERLLFNRLAPARITVPTWKNQLRAVHQLREISRFTQTAKVRLAEIELLPSALLREAFAPA